MDGTLSRAPGCPVLGMTTLAFPTSMDTVAADTGLGGGVRAQEGACRARCSTCSCPDHARPGGGGVVGVGRHDPCVGRTLRPASDQRGGVREHACPAAPRASGASPAPGRRRSRASRRTSASTRGRRSASRSTPARRRTASTSTGWATTAATARARSRPSRPTVLNNQPNCVTDAATGLVDCGNWTQNASWAVPATRCRASTSPSWCAPTARPGRATSSSSCVTTTARSDLLFQTSDTTWQAYNTYGGNSLYTGAPAGRAYKVSYNRPFTTRGNAPEDWVFNAEYPMVRFLESNGYDVSYTHRCRHRPPRAPSCSSTRPSCRSGHDEYWSGTQRANVEAARDAGVNLAFFSGNEVFWKTRWENSIDGSGTPHRTLVTYKETHANAKIDPLHQRRGPAPGATRASARPADGGRPENALTGHDLHDQLLRDQHGRRAGRRPDALLAQHPGGDPRPRTRPRPSARNVIGYEWDEDLDNGFRPPGSFRVSADDAGPATGSQDYGSELRAGHGDALDDDVPRAERRAGLRRRHDPVGVGARRQPRPRVRGPRHRGAAGDGQPVRRHGGAARRRCVPA